MNIYVGNMSFDVTEDSLKQAFGKYGEVTSARVISDRDTGQPRGFGFVEMADDDEARKAIEGLNGTDLAGRTLTVNEARPKRYGGGGGGGGRGRRNNW
jgi:RNA recognition motif-containing protein